MRRRRSGVLALAVVAVLSCTGCVKAGGFRTGEDKARDEARALALEDAGKVAEEVERLQFPQRGGDPGPPRAPPCMDQRWTGFLGAVEVAITRRAETGGGLFYATGSATVCVRFEIHGDNGPRRVTTREIDCPP